MKKRRGDTVTRRRGEKKPNPRVPASRRTGVSSSSSPSVPASPSLRVSASPRPRVSSPVPLITLLTDFGTADYFVSAMKGVILSINPDIRVVDITHQIPAQDIEAAAFTLLVAYGSFPKGTIHLAVVDPGVGSTRRAVSVEANGHFFVGPDNGIFSYVFESERDAKVFELTNEDYFRHPVSATFHGRDVFAPVAAALTTGMGPGELGKEITDPVRLTPLRPQKSKDGTIKGRIVHIDRFGNCITNLTPRELTPKMTEAGAYLVVHGTRIRLFRSFFSEQRGSGRELFAIWGSAGFLELAATNRSAAKVLRAKRGDNVVVSAKR